MELRPTEKRLLKDVLDPRNIGFMKYRALLREVQGMPQLDFLPAEVAKMARGLAEARDIDETLFKRLVDPDNVEMMSLQQLQESIAKVCNDQFQMGGE